MENSWVKISSKAAWSYAWNKSIDAKDSCAAKFRKSLKTLLCAFFSTYTVSIKNAEDMYNTKHKDSIFCKEYVKIIHREVDTLSSEVQQEKNSTVGATVPKNTYEKTTLPQLENIFLENIF